MTFHMDVREAPRVGSKRRRSHLLPMWQIVLMVVALLAGCSVVVLLLAVSLIAAAGSAVIGLALLGAFLVVVQSITPVAFVVIVARCIGIAMVARSVPALFEIILVCEVIFYARYRMKVRRWSKVRARCVKLSKAERWQHFRRVMASTPHLGNFVRGWFVGQPPLAALRRGNMREWLAWAFFDDNVDTLPREHIAELDQMLDRMRELHGVSFSPGYNPDVTSVRLNLDRHKSLHRPLLWYAVVYSMDFGTKMVMRGLGFRRYDLGGNRGGVFYWYRPAPEPGTDGDGELNLMVSMFRRLTVCNPVLRWLGLTCGAGRPRGPAPRKPARRRRRRRVPRRQPSEPLGIGGSRRSRPRSTTAPREMLGRGSESESESSDSDSMAEPTDVVIFFHGIGIGVSSYLPLIWNLLYLRQATCVLEVPCISTRLVSEITSRKNVVGAVGTMLHTHGHKRATLVGHSFGTIHAAWVLKAMPEAVLGSVLLDPVCMLLAEPEVCNHFMYRRPRNFDQLTTYLMASSEVHINHSIARHFFWHENILWWEDLPHNGTKTSVLLSGNDQIVPAHKIKDYLAKRNVHTLWYPKLAHGSFLASSAVRWRVVQATAQHHGCLDAFVESVGDEALMWLNEGDLRDLHRET